MISSGKTLGTKEMAIFIRKLDTYPMPPYLVYIEDRSEFWATIIPIQAFSKSGPRDEASFIDIRPTTTTELGPNPMVAGASMTLASSPHERNEMRGGGWRGSPAYRFAHPSYTCQLAFAHKVATFCCMFSTMIR